jgi:hypothetical protein
MFPPAPYSKRIGQRVSCRSSYLLLQDGDGGVVEGYITERGLDFTET